MIDRLARARVAKLAKTNTVRVAVDSVEGIDALSAAAKAAGSTIGILVDLDIGMHRTGVQSPAAALELAQHIARTPSLRLDGLFCYPGHVWNPAAEQGKPLSAIAGVARRDDRAVDQVRLSRQASSRPARRRRRTSRT